MTPQVARGRTYPFVLRPDPFVLRRPKPFVLGPPEAFSA